MDLTDAQWTVLEPTFRPCRRPDGRGRPWTDPRAVMNGVLWVLRTGAPWHDLPRRYPPYQTCHRRFQQWHRNGRLDKLLQRLTENLRDRGKLDLTEAFVDATSPGGKRGAAVGPTRRGKGSKIMAICDRHGLPLPYTWPALRREPHLVPATLDARFLADLPTRLINDRVAPGRKMAGHCAARRRWKIERLFAWFHNSRRLVTRWERKVENFVPMLHLACARILLRHL